MQIVIFADWYGVPQHLGVGRTAGPHRIATALRDAGFLVQVIDHYRRFTAQQLAAVVAKYVTTETLFVGFSSTLDMSFYADDAEDATIACIVEQARAVGAKIVVGGGNADLHNIASVDYWVHGYADHAVVALARHLRDGSPLRARPSLRQPHALVVDGNEYPAHDIATLAIRWHESDHIMHGEALPMEVARGCIFRCAFCSFPLNGKKNNEYIVAKETIAAQLWENWERWGVTSYVYSDDTHNDNPAKLAMMRDIVQTLPYRHQYTSYLRLDLLHAHPETIALLKEGGLRSAFFGIETLNHRSGKAIKKGMDPWKQIEFLWTLRRLWRDEVRFKSGFILGLPHDTQQTYEETLAFVISENNPLDAWNLLPLRIENQLYYQTRRLDVASAYSEFAKNFAAYGYCWDEEAAAKREDTALVLWRKDDVSYRATEAFVQQHRAPLGERQKLAWVPLLFRSHLGLDEAAEAMTMKELFATYDLPHLMQRVVDRYYASLINY